MKQEAPRLVAKVAHALEVAQKLLGDGYPSDAASKTYYSMVKQSRGTAHSGIHDVMLERKLLKTTPNPPVRQLL